MKESVWQFTEKLNLHKNCPCVLCRASMLLRTVIFEWDAFYKWLRSKKFVRVEFWGSNYADFREYEVIEKRRISTHKAFPWPKTAYKYVRAMDEQSGKQAVLEGARKILYGKKWYDNDEVMSSYRR